MKAHPFDERIKKRLQGYESEVPEDMWQRIMQEKKRPKFILLPRRYILLALLLLLGTVTSVFYFKTVDQRMDPTLNTKQTQRPAKTMVIDKKADSSNKKTLTVIPHVLNKRSKPLIASSIHNTELKRLMNLTSKPKQNKSAIEPVVTKTDLINTANSFHSDSEHDSTITNNALPIKKQIVPDSADHSITTKPEEQNDHHDKFSIELYAAPVEAFGDMKDDDMQYQKILREAGSTKTSYTLGAGITIQITKNISAKTGLRHLQINETMSIPDSFRSGNIVVKNKYKNIGIPLQFIMKITKAENFSASLNTGIVLNISSRYIGALPAVNYGRLDLNKDIVYKKNANVMIHFGVNLAKQLKKRTDIFAEPWLEYRVKNMVNDNYTFTRKLHNSGVSFGVRYRLYKIQAP